MVFFTPNFQWEKKGETEKKKSIQSKGGNFDPNNNMGIKVCAAVHIPYKLRVGVQVCISIVMHANTPITLFFFWGRNIPPLVVANSNNQWACSV